MSNPEPEQPRKEAIHQVHESVDSTTQGTEKQAQDSVEWFPGVRRQFPWLGASGIACVLVAMALGTAILCSSDGRMVKNWPTTKYPLAPNVLLNLVNQLSTLGLITAISQGLAIAWWRKALKGGKLSTLHRDHSYSWSFLAVVTSGKHFNTIALAALMAKFTIIDSTLFQQATKTSLDYKVDYQNSTVDAWIGSKWPAEIGGIPGTDGETRALSRNFTDIIDAFNTKIGNGKVHDTETLFQGCPPGQTCTSSLDALGFSFDCDVNIENIDYGSWRLENATKPNQTDDYPLWSVEFHTNWPTATRSYTSINLTMIYVNTEEGPLRSCPGTRTRRTCEIRPAVVRYPLMILMADSKQAMNVTHLGFTNTTTQSYPFNTPMNDDQIDGVTVVNQTDLHELSSEISTVGAITFALNNLFKSSANLSWGFDWDLDVSGARAQAEFPADSTEQIADHCNYQLDQTSRGFSDPFIELLREVNNFGFVAALYLSGAPFVDVHVRNNSGYPSFQLHMAVKGYVEQYKTNYSYLAGALVATLFTVVCVLPVYWGFWELGRKVTLGPFEIANALNAPIFDQASKKNGHVDDLLDEVGKRRVQYGQLTDQPGQLAMAEPHQVQKPIAKEGGISASTVGGAGLGATVGAVIAAVTLGKAAT